MKAYELFCQDLRGDELVRSNTNRKTYYNTLREALRAELTAGASCELLAHYARRLEDGAPGYMYLLDAAALWECYEGVLNGPRRFPRDIGPGFPFTMASGVRITWPEVQRQSDMGVLPVAVVDDALRARISGLVVCMNTPVAERAARLRATAADPREKIAMADASAAGKIPVPGEDTPEKPAIAPEGTALQAQLAECQQALAKMRREYDAIHTELTQLRSQPRQSNEEMVQLVEMILHGQMTEAAALAQRLGGEVNEIVQRVHETQKTVTLLKGELDKATEQLQADTAQHEAIMRQYDNITHRMAEVRQACEQAQTDAAAVQQENREAEKQLSEAMETLRSENARLREIQTRMARVNAAADLTRRQADHLS